jgi:hypothetical protein
MRELNPAAGIAAIILAAAVAVWWLGSLALLPVDDGGRILVTSAAATRSLILGQWLMIALLTPLWTVGCRGVGRLFILASACLPLWPLLAALWAASGVSAIGLAASQLVAAALFGGLAAGAGLLQRLPIDPAAARLMTTAVGAGLAVTVWTLRSTLGGWIGA